MLLVRRNKKKEAERISGQAINHLHAFEDLTDKENPDFRCEFSMCQLGGISRLMADLRHHVGKRAGHIQ